MSLVPRTIESQCFSSARIVLQLWSVGENQRKEVQRMIRWVYREQELLQGIAWIAERRISHLIPFFLPLLRTSCDNIITIPDEPFSSFIFAHLVAPRKQTDKTGVKLSLLFSSTLSHFFFLPVGKISVTLIGCFASLGNSRLLHRATRDWDNQPMQEISEYKVGWKKMPSRQTSSANK